MLTTFGKYTIDIEIGETRSFYAKAAAVSETCSCDGCQNFEKAVDVLPDTIKIFFADLGIDMRKVCECYVLGANKDGTLLYGGFYHICGTLLKDSGAPQETGKNSAHVDNSPDFDITPDFSISFSEEADLPEPDFPAPVIQLEFSANIPWVLDKDNPYSGTESYPK